MADRSKTPDVAQEPEDPLATSKSFLSPKLVELIEFKVAPDVSEDPESDDDGLLRPKKKRRRPKKKSKGEPRVGNKNSVMKLLIT
jgi:hypothetical protein